MCYFEKNHISAPPPFSEHTSSTERFPVFDILNQKPKDTPLKRNYCANLFVDEVVKNCRQMLKIDRNPEYHELRTIIFNLRIVLY